jgi:nucleotide-binding universal stress UspA family protein
MELPIEFVFAVEDQIRRRAARVRYPPAVICSSSLGAPDPALLDNRRSRGREVQVHAIKGDTMKVLLAIDGSPHSQAAIGAVTRRPWAKGTAVEILTVLHSPAPMMIDPALVIAGVHAEQSDEERQQASTLLDGAGKQIARAAPGVTITTRILEGSPKDVIVEEARAWNADLIVLGSHGYGRFRRMVLGSVAGAVVANAPCSVQVAREKRDVEGTAA